MKHALRIAAQSAAPRTRNIYPLSAESRLSAVLRDGVAARAQRMTPHNDAGFSPLVQEFLDECGYSDK